MPTLHESFYLAIALLVGLVIARMTLSFSSLTKIQEWRENRFHRKLKSKLERIGKLFCVNTHGDVFAICNIEKLEIAVSEHILRIDTENGPKAWEKISVCVQPTYTFAHSIDSRRPIHTGTRTQIEEMFGDFLCLYFNYEYGRELFQGRLLGELIKLISRKDSRLYVPFASDKHEAKWDLYKPTSLKEAQKDLFDRNLRKFAR